MARKVKIDLEKLSRLLAEGKSGLECAEIFKVSPAAISQARKRLRGAMVKHTALEAAPAVSQRWLNIVDQLHNINRNTHEILDQAMGLDCPNSIETALKAAAEIRRQLKLQVAIMQDVYDTQAAREFQEEVLRVIGELDPNAKDKIVRRLKERRALRTSVEI